MVIPSWLVDAIVLLGVAYLSLVMALGGWVSGLRRGEAVMLLRARSGRSNVAVQLAVAVFGLAISVALFYFLWIPLPVAVGEGTRRWLIVSGLALFVLGSLLILWARSTLGRMWSISTSREVKLLADHQLVDTGPYALVRHPMYLGWWVALVGTILIYRTWILVLLLVFSLVVFYRRARLEERMLAGRFGAAWQTYASSTRFLVPWIY